MNKIRISFFAIATLLLFSCNTKGNKKNIENRTKDTIVPVVKENFPKGEVIEQVVCKSDATQSYAMYLPKNYSTDKTYPVVYAFDAHGTGKLPVVKYKDLAEQYGYILIGSNNSKNGNAWEESVNIAEKLFADAQNRLSINTQRIYLLGFSGGARVANGITITNGAIEGVICCGAAAPGMNSKNPRNNYTWMGIAGNEDFNYTEIRKYDMVDLAGHAVKHALLTFDGKHEWCPVEVMDEAFWWLELCEMRKNSALKNDTLIKQRIAPAIKQIETFMQKNQTFEAYQICKKTINFYDGLADLTYCFKIYKQLQTDAGVDKGMKLEETVWAKEEQQKQYYMSGFQATDFERWKREIAGLNQKIKTEKDKNTVLMYKRVLGYLSLAAYMQSSGALKQNAIPQADYFSKIYELVDPTNNEAYYLSAAVAAKEGKLKDAITALNESVKNGFKDLPRLQSDSAFISLKGMKEFDEVQNKIGK